MTRDIVCLPETKVFSRKDVLSYVNGKNMELGEASVNAILNRLLKTKVIARAGCNAYYRVSTNARNYSPSYSTPATEIAGIISQTNPYINFVITETVLLNEFLNLQIGKNTIFVYVENGSEEFVFHQLNDRFPGKVLLKPDLKTFDRYWSESTIVVERLISESPVNVGSKWKVRIEKLIVDLFADKILKTCFSKSELPGIIETIFERYFVDESSLFRYARRRNCEEKIQNYLNENTEIELMTR